ncbi:MAG: dihydrolipoamide acetyltransferase family protein, partial [Anaerolineae bacterium]
DDRPQVTDHSSQTTETGQSSIQNPKSILASPRARALARERAIDLATVSGTAPGGVIVARDVLAALQQPDNVSPTTPVRATPVAQRMAAELGVDLASLIGTGPDGRITREDVERAAQAANRQPSQAGYLALSPARRVTAQRLAESARTAPQVTLTTEADATSLVSAREQLSVELGEKVSYNTLLAMIAARALKEHPNLNAAWDESGNAPRLLLRDAIHIGVAVDTERGLYVPVLRDCATKSLAQLHRELNDLIARAVAGRLAAEEMSGGTFTITNLGMYEIDAFTPILNLPEAAILGVGRILARPVALENQVVIRQMMTLSLTFDHRVVDGAPAARFLQRLKTLIERPFALLV